VAFAPHCDVANAVGAAAGVVAHSITVRVVGDGTGNFRVHAPSGTRQFSNPTEALDTARAWAEQLARSAVLSMGAYAPEVKLSVEKQWMPNAVNDTGLLEAVVVVEAIGGPSSAAQAQ
jgi:hypothetical protein